jgi:hypothetical protein
LLPKTAPDLVLANRSASVAWPREHLPHAQGAACRIYVNIVDLIHTFMADSDWACVVLERLAA